MQLPIRRGAHFVGAGVLGFALVSLCFDAPAGAVAPLPPTTTWPGSITEGTWPGKIVDSATVGPVGSTAPVTSSPPATSPPATSPRPRTAIATTASRSVVVATTVLDSAPSTATTASRSVVVATIALDSAPSTAADPVGTGADPSASVDVWAKLRKCESGGRYDINSGNGYYGAYQFAAKTWTKLGYEGLPHQAAPEVQDEAARKLQTKAGWGQWPACSRRLGLK